MFDISVVIVNYNNRDEIDRCLSSLYADCAHSSLVIKVVVVDNASTDGSVEFLRNKYPDAHFNVQLKNLGFGKAQNIGIKLFPAKYYLILNPDTYIFPDTHTLERLYSYMELHQDAGLVGPKTVYPDGTLQYSCCRFPTLWQPVFSRTKLGLRGKGKERTDRHLMKDFDHNSTRPVDWVIGSVMFVRGSGFDTVGLFDERFWMYYEDSDLCRRFWENHLPVYYLPAIVVEHAHHRTSAKVGGVIMPFIKNKYAWIHTWSWLKYMWKWRGNYKYYS